MPDLIATLSGLRELPKPTYWYEGDNRPNASFWLKGTPEYREQIARICRSRCGRLEGLTAPVAAELTQGVLPIGLSVWPSFNGWPYSIDSHSFDYWKDLEAHCKNAATLLGTAASRVRALLIDYEQWRGSSPADPVVRRIQIVSDILRGYFPFAVQYWYQCDQQEFLHGWAKSSYGAEFLVPTVPSSCTLYQANNYSGTILKLEKNLSAATLRGQPLVPIVSLGAAWIMEWWERTPNFWLPESHRYASTRIPSWMIYRLGSVLYHSSFKPPDFPGNINIPAVCLYPGPGDARFPHWDRNFIQMCLGAHQVVAVPEEYRVDERENS